LTAKLWPGCLKKGAEAAGEFIETFWARTGEAKAKAMKAKIIAQLSRFHTLSIADAPYI
jgi:hypothetical protein